ncbi:MAG: hypothetical protein OXQ28_06810 [Acidobacteriota bacterium]|nr:hypothetical protein [Acidobacteriota bacterium]
MPRSFKIAMARRVSQPPNQSREVAPRPLEVDCPVQPDSVLWSSVPTSIRSLCTWWFRASNVITDAHRRSWLTS